MNVLLIMKLIFHLLKDSGAMNLEPYESFKVMASVCNEIFGEFLEKQING